MDRAFHWGGLLILAALAACSACAKDPQRADDPRQGGPRPDGPFAFVVETRSIGTGVPEQAQEVLERCRALLADLVSAGHPVSTREARIGLEGETQLRAEFDDAELGREMLAKVRSFAAGVELIHVEEVPAGADTEAQ